MIGGYRRSVAAVCDCMNSGGDAVIKPVPRGTFPLCCANATLIPACRIQLFGKMYTILNPYFCPFSAWEILEKEKNKMLEIMHFIKYIKLEKSEMTNASSFNFSQV